MTSNSQKYYAGFWVRFFAGLLDIFFLLVPFLVLFPLFADKADLVKISNDFESYTEFTSSASGRLANSLSYALSTVYIGYFLSSKQQATLGKRFLGIYVGNPDGSRLSKAKSVARALASFITTATLGLGFLPVIFTKEKTALHDLICNTRVFHGRKNVRN